MGEYMLELAIVTDEIDADVRKAIEIGTSWGIKKYELRCIGSNRIPNISKDDIMLLVRLKDDYNITYTALSPGILKLPISSSNELQHEVSTIYPLTLELAEKINVDTIIVFGFKKDGEDVEGQNDDVLNILHRVEDEAKKGGFRILIENEPGFWCDTGSNTAKLLSKLNSPVIGANWDPANAIGTDETPYPDGYKALKNFIGNVHAKDTDSHALERCVAIGEGLVDWEGQIKALVQDRIVPHITIETHVLPLIENSLRNTETLKKYIASAMD